MGRCAEGCGEGLKDESAEARAPIKILRGLEVWTLLRVADPRSGRAQPLDLAAQPALSVAMKMNRAFSLFSLSLVAGLICAGCKREEPAPAPAPTPPPVVTNTPPPAAVAPKAETPATPPAAAATGAAFYTPEQAKDHVGEEATVRGKVFGVHITQKGDAFLNIGAAHPDAPFTAVCFAGAIPAETLNAFDGKTVSIKGKIKDYKGKVEIVLDKAEQIKVAE